MAKRTGAPSKKAARARKVHDRVSAPPPQHAKPIQQTQQRGNVNPGSKTSSRRADR